MLTPRPPKPLPHGVTLAGYCYVMRHGVKVQIVTPYRVSHWQRYGVTVRGNVTGVYKSLDLHSLSLPYPPLSKAGKIMSMKNSNVTIRN
jgi:hypothetical protein